MPGVAMQRSPRNAPAGTSARLQQRGALALELAHANLAAGRAPVTMVDALVAGSVPQEMDYDLMGDAAMSVYAELKALWRPRRDARPPARATPRETREWGSPVPVGAHWRYDMGGMRYCSTSVRGVRFGRRRSCTVARSVR